MPKEWLTPGGKFIRERLLNESRLNLIRAAELGEAAEKAVAAAKKNYLN